VRRALIVVLFAVPTVWALAEGKQTAPSSAISAGPQLSDPFAVGWFVADTNGDAIADAVTGKIVLPESPTAAENASAANLAARIAYGATGLTLPVVVTAAAVPADRPRIWVGRAAPESAVNEVRSAAGQLAEGEGGVFAVAENLVVAGDDTGLGAAADGFSARAPYQWRVPGEKFADITEAVNAAGHGSGARLVGVTYMRGEQGIHRAIVRAGFTVNASELTGAYTAGRSHVAAVRQLVVVGGRAPVSATNPKALGVAQPNAGAGIGEGPVDAPAAGPGGGAGAATRLDLATVYTSRGLFTGTARMPLPSSSDAHLYVPPGAAGIAMANLAARMGLETTGITLPIASPASAATARQVRTQAVIAGDSALAQEVEKKLRDEDTAAAQAEPPLAAAEGELRVVDDSFGRRGAILVRGDQAGSAAALDLLAGHFPNVWEPGKQYQSLEEIRYDLHRFFSLRSGAGQASAELYTLAQWMKEIKEAGAGVSNVKAELYADLADPGLAAFAQKQIQQELGVSAATVKAASLRAGTQCCDKTPELHFETPGYPYQQGTPTFAEDLVIPWEGTRLLNAVQGAASKVKAGQEVKLLARVSEGLEQRQKLQTQIEEMLTKAGADKRRLHVEVLCAFKPGLSWLMDEIAPDLAGKGAAAIHVEFAKDVDPSGTRTMYSPSRWLHELYPVDEMLALKLKMPREKITFSMFEPTKGGPTYRVRATDAGGAELLSREFSVPTVMQPYNGVMKSYEQVEVDTGWVRLDVGADKVLDQRIMTDLEMFWDYYQNKTLPDVYQFVMSQAHGNMRDEFVPPFDTLKMDIHMSEPEYQIAGVDHERVSALEALQEDTFYSTANFVEMWGRLETGQQTNYTGRIIPVVHPPAADEGKDGHVRIEFYAKQAANPLVRLAWTDKDGKAHVRERAIPVLTGDMMPRLIQAQTKAGSDAIENLTWLLPADYKKDDFENWSKVERRDQVDRTIFSVEKASGELHWLEQMHAAGIYRDSLAYQRVRKMGVEFELPPEINKETLPAERSYVSWSVPAPATPRPMITDYAGKVTHTPIVQWDEPIDSAENAGILARFSTFPGVTVYWMGRSYLGQNIWAADIMLPSPSTLRSWAKETTLKASVVYSGRQHANEVSSTSHINKLAEQLLTDPAVRANLKQVNVVIHPITNPDGAELSVILAKITPDNMLHPGYHGSLSADVASNQTDLDPVYPESRTRKQLADAWLPDAFLNPHGYPSHEWVQPFSEYTGWVTNRQGANPSRANWIARGWFTSLGYFRDPDLPYSKLVAFTLQDQIVAAERAVPGLLPLETNMVDRYRRWAHDWQPEDVADSVVNGITMNMALKGTARGGGRGGAPGSGGIGGLSPDITWDAGYTEAPDETAHGDYMKLLASAGLAFDKVHLHYLANGTLRITRTERDVLGGVQRRFDRARPILPASVKPPATDR
jgi:hypothetical protein